MKRITITTANAGEHYTAQVGTDEPLIGASPDEAVGHAIRELYNNGELANPVSLALKYRHSASMRKVRITYEVDIPDELSNDNVAEALEPFIHRTIDGLGGSLEESKVDHLVECFNCCYEGAISEFIPNSASGCPECPNCGYEGGKDRQLEWAAQFTPADK